MTGTRHGHGADLPVSPWIARFAGLIPEGGRVLDVAAGGGRHTRYLLERGHRVTAIDVDISGLQDLVDRPGAEVVEADLEDGSPWPYVGHRFAAVVVTNYLYRPLVPNLVNGVAPGGVLLYETFAEGNERFGRPSNLAFLLRPGELLEAVAGRLHVLAYEDLIVDEPKPAAVQRICARREG